ncbi:MAG: hypothetical protein JNL41_07145 [Phenylobacterium sp.]|uniref:hypothetical protein n=1 Tax=Phenylobacterium sp. TaxID=1871053 RepID=UPI001A37EC3D|nr:hypothetical protein [Phenylobacterium sp.]MBL8554037.1 hypothetical protein [Phenylobacterium sp.]
MSYRWGFDLFGSNLIAGLSWSLHGPDIAILRYEEDDRPPVYFWSSVHLDELTPGPELFARAAALKVVFDGALYLLTSSYRPDRLGDLYDMRSDKRVSAYEVAAGGDPFSSTIVRRPLDKDARRLVSDQMLEGAIYLARSDLAVRGMLTVLGTHGLTYASLYQLMDFLKTHGMSEDDIVAAAGSTKAELKRFTHTANNFAAIGPAGRHGDLGYQPPRKPMTIDEASALILPAAQRFIAKRIVATMKATS